MKLRNAMAATIAAAALMLAGCQASPYATAEDAGWNHYGHSVNAGNTVVALGQLSDNREHVIVEGTITKVCEKKGCWMNVADDAGHELFVRFQDYSFFVPKNAAGHRVVIHGNAEATMVPVDELRHYAQDAGKSAEEIAAITEPERRVTFFADSVYIEGEGLEEPHQQ